MPESTLNAAVPLPLRQLFSYAIGAETATQLQPGMRVRVTFGNRELIGYAVELVNTRDTNYPLKPIVAVIDQQPVFDSDIWQMCLWAANYYHYPLGEVLHSALPSLLREGLPASVSQEDCWQLSLLGKGLPETALKRAPKQQHCLNLLRRQVSIGRSQLAELEINKATIKALEDKQLIERLQQAAPRSQPPTAVQDIALNDEQQSAYQEIRGAYGEAQTFLLDGVTGSGKTEVYLACIRDMLAAGKQTLVIVPEINLTPQFVKRFEQRLGISPAVLHSGLSNRQRLDSWVDARDGRAAVIIGTRSALFTPLQNPGLFIVDEEHATSLKQHEGFRYSARDCLIWRAKQLGIPIVLGSGTVSLESYQNSLHQRYRLLALTVRANSAKPPQWQIDDIRAGQLFAGLSQTSIAAIQSTLAKNQQVLVFINRLGYAPTLQCHNCGWHAQCTQCDANQTVFLGKQRLRCNHCDRTDPLPKACPSCASFSLQTTGQGTEQVSAYLETRFPQYPVIRIDSETSSGQQQLQQHIDTINRGDACIIVGTQIMAKGHDFSKLSLAVVINADDAIISANYRAAEKSAQLLTQVAGRTGRGAIAGKVIVQSHYPEHALLRLLTRNNYRAVLEQERNQRQQLSLPPFSYEAIIMSTSKDPDAPERLLQTLLTSFQWQILTIGPLPARLARKAGWFRAELSLRSADRKQLHQYLTAAEQWLTDNSAKYRCKWTVDVDPVA